MSLVFSWMSPSCREMKLCFSLINGEETRRELLFQKMLETDIKDESIFKVVQELFEEKQIPLTNIVACVTGEAPSMTGLYRGFISFLTKLVPGVLTVHYVIHKQHLVKKVNNK